MTQQPIINFEVPQVTMTQLCDQILPYPNEFIIQDYDGIVFSKFGNMWHALGTNKWILDYITLQVTGAVYLGVLLFGVLSALC